MSRVKIILDTRRKLIDDTFPIKFSIFISKNCRFFISSGISVEENHFFEGKIIINPRKNILNNVIKTLYFKIDDALLNLSSSGEIKNLSPKQIKEQILNIVDNKPENDSPITIVEHFNTFISKKTRAKTIETYESTLKKILKYFNSSLTFEQINLSWVRNFENLLIKEGLAVNTISIHLRNLRTVFNNAIDEDIIPQNLYPFRKFQIKTEETIKRSLTIDELRLLKDYPCEQHQQKYRDIFMLMFYLAGINSIDLFNNKKSDNIIKDRINYRRRKTGRLYSIKIEPEAQEIIDRYQGKKYLIDVFEKVKNSDDYLKRLGKNLKQIGEVEIGKQGKKTRKPILPNISSYWARHTWATMAGELEIPKETIAFALGHGKKEVTDIYIQFNIKKIDEANRKVIDYLNGK